MDLIRKILLAIEAHPTLEPMAPLAFDGYTAAEIYQHLRLLQKAGFIEVFDKSSNTANLLLPTALTWDGHEFLDNARSDKRWNQALNLVKGTGGLALEVLKNVLTNLALAEVNELLRRQGLL
ncbi:MAG: DUF2513 domain-containing protein [Anaerolineales bacterium]|nr:DUF2513 domain-containing protein [Anaerolineales bacterium]